MKHWRSSPVAIEKAGYKLGEDVFIRARPGDQRNVGRRKRQVPFLQVRPQTPGHQRRNDRYLGRLVQQVPDPQPRRRAGRKRLGRLDQADRQAGRQDPACRRRHLRHQREVPGAWHSREERQRHPGQDQPDRLADRNLRPRSIWRRATDSPRSSAIAAARPKTPSSPTWRSPPAPARSRPAAPRAATASPSTTACCGSKKTSAKTRSTAHSSGAVRKVMLPHNLPAGGPCAFACLEQHAKAQARPAHRPQLSPNPLFVVFCTFHGGG